MRHSLIALTIASLACGCGGSDNDDLGTPSDPGAEPGTGGDGGGGGGGTVTAGYSLGEPVLVTSAQAALTGLTSDGYAVFRDSGGLKAVVLEEGAEPQLITETPGVTHVRGNIVLSWQQPDYTTNVANLGIWTAETGMQNVGTTLLAQDLVAVNEDGNVIYTKTIGTDRLDLIIDRVDLSAPQVVITGMGRGDDATCRPSYSFVGSSAFVGYCQPGTRAGRIVRLDPTDGGWTVTELVTGTQPIWSADSSGSRLFYMTTGSQGFVLDGGTSYQIDNSIGWGMMLPDGSGVLYTVGDQLRRSPFPEISPTPVVTRDFRQRTAMSADHRWALFSTVIDYDNGQRQDLRLTATDGFTETPTVIVDSPAANMSRAAFTADGMWALYLTNFTAGEGGMLHAFNTTTGSERTFENAFDVIAVADSVIVFTDNHSPTGQYPPTADMKIVDLATDQEPELVEERILDGRAHYIDQATTTLVYARSGVNADATVNAANQAVISRSLR